MSCEGVQSAHGVLLVPGIIALCFPVTHKCCCHVSEKLHNRTNYEKRMTNISVMKTHFEIVKILKISPLAQLLYNSAQGK